MKKNFDKGMLKELLVEVLDSRGYSADEIECSDFIQDYGLDSITFVTIVVEIEQKFNVKILDEDLLLEKFRSLESIIYVIERAEDINA